MTSHKSSVQSFSLVCTELQSAAIPSLLHNVTLHVRGRKQLAVDAQQCINILSRRGFKHVRSLLVGGRMPQQLKDTNEMQRYIEQGKEWDFRFYDKFDIRNINTRHDAYYAPYAPPGSSRRLSVYDEDSAWMPLARLIELLNALSDFTYTCPNQFSPCLLRSLTKNRPSCRLHLKTFTFNGLNQVQPDTHELALATSPCLHSLSISCHTNSPLIDSRGGYKDQAILDLMTGSAPNLKDVSMFRMPWDESMGWIEAQDSSRRTKPWQAFLWDEQDQIPANGSMRRLQVDSFPGSIKRWSRHACLTDLHVFKHTDPLASYELEFLAMRCSFSSLTTLDINLNCEYERPLPVMKMDYFNAACHFLQSLPPLMALRIVVSLTTALLDIITEYHGGALKKLCLLPEKYISPLVFGHQEVAKIQASCPQLEELALAIPRTRGSANEVAIYKTIGSFSKVNNLLIELDANCFDIFGAFGVLPPNDPTFNEFDQLAVQCGPDGALRNGHVRDAFINSALDETLALAIVKSISAAKPTGSLPFENVELRVKCATQLDGAFGDVVEQLGRSWLLERNPRDDTRDNWITTEIKREKIDAGQGPLLLPLEPAIEPIFRRIWPAKGDRWGWRNDWHSFPLWEEYQE